MTANGFLDQRTARPVSLGVVILLRLYRPARLGDRIRARRGVGAEGSTAALGGSGAAHCDGGFDSGSGGFEGGNFDGGGGGGGPC